MFRKAVLVFSSAALLALGACSPPAQEVPVKQTPPAPVTDPTKLTDAQWRARLTPEQYHVCREGGTEAPDSGAYMHEKRAGTYECVACRTPLFSSQTKYEACGWPAFWEALPGAVSTRPAGGALEAVCARCGSHLGHLFDDGPPPTGKRY